MSVSESDEDEPMEPGTCEIHDTPRPCEHCQSRMIDWTFDSRRDERDVD